MAVPGFGDKWSLPLPLDPPGTPATRRAQSHLVAARARPDGSIVAGLSNAYVADCPEVGAWLFGCATDRPPMGKLSDIGIVYRLNFEDQPASEVALHGECMLSQVTVGPFVMGTVLASHRGHPFIPMGSAVCGIPFEDVCTRRRFAVNLSSACLDYVEAAYTVDGRVLVHERRVVLAETGQFLHEAIRWYNSAGAIGKAPPRSACLAQLLMRSWERSEVCLDCSPVGVAVRQPCPHKVATVRGLPMLTFDQWCGSAGALALAGTSSFELQQYAAAIMAASPEDPTRGDTSASEMGVVTALPPVGYRYSFHRSDDALSFFSNSMRRSILGGGDQPSADSLRLGTPIYQATVALANDAAVMGGGKTKEEDEARQQTRAHRLISEVSKAFGKLPPGYGASGPPRDGAALMDLVPTEVALCESDSEPAASSVASVNSEAVTDIVVAAAESVFGSGGVSSSVGVPSVDGASTGGTEPATGSPQAGRMVSTNLRINGASPKGRHSEGPDLADAAGRKEDLALPFPVSQLNPTELGGVKVEQAQSGLTETFDPVSSDVPVTTMEPTNLVGRTYPSAPSMAFFPTAPNPPSTLAGPSSPTGSTGLAAPLGPLVPGGIIAPTALIAPGEPVTVTRNRGSVEALYDAIAQRTRPLCGPVTRFRGSQPPERGMDANVVDDDVLSEVVPPMVGARSPLAADRHLTGSLSNSGSSSSLDAARHVEGSSTVDAARPVSNPIVLPPTLPTGDITTSEDPPSSSVPSTSSAATAPPAFAATVTTPSPLAPELHADPHARRAKVHPCPLCDAAFASRSDVTRHVTTVHERRRQWPCEHPGCKFTGLQKGHLTTHVAAVHHAARPYVCTECNTPGRPPFRAISRSAVERHVRRVHRGIRPYGCPSCRQAFASRSDLKRHCQRQHGAAACGEDKASGSGGHAGQTQSTAGGGGGDDVSGEAEATLTEGLASLPGSGDGGN